MKIEEVLIQMNRECRGTLVEHLGIEFTGIGEDWLEARMPIDERTMRPGNLLHGGAIMALAETVGSGITYVSSGGISRVRYRDKRKPYPEGSRELCYGACRIYS